MTGAGKPVSRWRVDSALVFVALIWGSTFVIVKQALGDVSTLLFLTLRFGLAAVVLIGVLGQRAKAETQVRGNLGFSVRGGVLAGACLFTGYIFQTFGLKYTTAAKAGFITGFYIPLVPLLAALVYRKLPQPAELLGVVTAFIGMVLMTVQGDLFSIAKGDLLVMGCTVAYALHILVLGHFAAGASTSMLALTQIVTGAILGGATFWWCEPVSIRWSPDVLIAISVTGLLATALAFLIQTWAQQYSSPTRTALIFSMEPLFAWATSYILLGELLTRRALAGAGLILAGILLVELKPLPFRRKRTA